MKEINANLKHDFINNSLRIEVISRLVCESLNKNEKLNDQHINDLEDFLQKEINLLKEIKSHLHQN